jgi:hypothetical protein
VRFIKIPTREMGELRILLISEENGQWEPEWEPLRGTIFGDQFSRISKETLEHALNRWSRPLVDTLGIPPVGALKKIPFEGRACFRRRTCPLFNPKQCFPEAKVMSSCFEPDGVPDEIVRYAATRAFEYWREGVYLVVVQP